MKFLTFTLVFRHILVLWCIFKTGELKNYRKSRVVVLKIGSFYFFSIKFSNKNGTILV